MTNHDKPEQKQPQRRTITTVLMFAMALIIVAVLAWQLLGLWIKLAEF